MELDGEVMELDGEDTVEQAGTELMVEVQDGQEEVLDGEDTVDMVLDTEVTEQAGTELMVEVQDGEDMVDTVMQEDLGGELQLLENKKKLFKMKKLKKHKSDYDIPYIHLLY